MDIKKNDWKILLIRSTFGINIFSANGSTYGEEELPKNSCDFSKMLILSIVTFPFVWISHVINLIRRRCELNGWHGLLLHIVGIALGFYFCFAFFKDTAESKPYGILSNHITSFYGRLFFLYITAGIYLIAVLLAFIVVFYIAAFIVMPIMNVWEMITEIRDKNKNKSKEIESKTWFHVYIKGLKDKYCVSINYISDKVETPN